MHRTLQGLFPLEVQTYSVELERGLNLLPLIFFLLPPRLPEKDGLWLDLNIKKKTISVCLITLYFKWMQFTAAPAQNTEFQSSLLMYPVHWCYQIPSFPNQEKKKDSVIRNVLLSVGRRAEELTKKNKSLQPGTTQYRIKVMWTDGFRMLPYTLPRVTPRSSIFTDVWNMFCVWNPFTPRMRKSIWPEIENVYILFKNIIKWMFWNQ